MAALKALVAARASEEKSFRSRHDALAAEEAAAAARYAEARTQAETALERERDISKVLSAAAATDQLEVSGYVARDPH